MQKWRTGKKKMWMYPCKTQLTRILTTKNKKNKTKTKNKNNCLTLKINSMKKILLFAAAAIMMVGCSKDQVVSEMPQDNAINFGMYFGRDAQSRAAIMDLDDLKAQSFGVFAYYTDNSDYVEGTSTPNFMFDQFVEHDGSAWTYSPLKYWPNEATDKLSFFAYAPHTSESNGNIALAAGFDNASASAPSITYTLDADQSKHVDLLWAAPVKNETKQTTTEKVHFIFKHAMSRIGFKSVAVIDEVNGDNNGEIDDATHSNALDGNTKITLKSIKLIGNFYQGGTLNLATGAWSDYAAAASTEYNWATTDFLNDDVTTTKAVVLNDDKYLTVLPYTGSQQIQIEVVYTVKTTDTSLDLGYSEVTNTIVSDPFDFTFVQGYAYNFVLHVGLTSVKFSADVTPWTTNEEDIVVNVPLNN